MGVTNLEGNQEENHAKHVAEFAIDMINAASKVLIDEEEPNKGYIHIRVGFHSGPVVSNVIGSLNPRYGLVRAGTDLAEKHRHRVATFYLVFIAWKFHSVISFSPNQLLFYPLSCLF